MNLSQDALALATLWRKMRIVTGITFNTPSKIHPRFLAAANELIKESVLKEVRVPLAEPGTYKTTFKVRDMTKLDALPLMSDRAAKKVGLPITVE